MRRSCAPSRKFNNLDVLLSSDQLLKKEVVEAVKENNGSTSQSQPHQRQVYKVVWSKRTMKKHKTWEGDGTLEIKNKFAILKDITGTVLGSSKTLKPEDIFEGNQAIIGSREIEFVEELSGSTFIQKHKSKKNRDEDSGDGDADQEPKEKKRKAIGVFTPNLQLSTTPKMLAKIPKVKSVVSKAENQNNTADETAFILPTPNYDHQWAHNTNKKSLTEVQVSNSLVKHLRPHQRNGVIFLYECLIGIRNSDYFGAILADEMGLGKTLQILAVCHTLLKQAPYGTDRMIHRVLVVTPSSLTDTWSDEINKWLGSERMYAYVVDAKHKLKNYRQQLHIPFVIVSYETLVNNCEDFELVKFDLLVCDEGHRLKNNKIKASVCLKQLNIKHTVILSGTPIQNNLQEFFYLVDFVNPGILGRYSEYKSKYENPICKSQAPDADEATRLIGYQKSEELTQITSSFILRRTQSINNEYLPNKREYIVFVRPSELQKILLKKVLEWFESKDDSITKNSSHLQVINLLKKICNHPSLIRTVTNKTPITLLLEKYLPNWSELGPFDSGKLELVQYFLQEIHSVKKEKVVLVSNYTGTLDMIQGLCDHLEYKYSRLDGQTNASDRHSIVEKFNRNANTETFIFLLSAKAGGVGLNLSGASRLILFDNDWNPATDLQAMSRIWRDGQKTDVKIYRLITAGTIEEKIFQRQIAKTSLGGCVIDQINDATTMRFSQEELKDLFTIQDDSDTCATHDSLQCNCDGDGKKQPCQTEEIEKDPFKISLNMNCSQSQSTFQMNELMKWEHYSLPIPEDFLKDASLFGAIENINFIFSNQFEYSS